MSIENENNIVETKENENISTADVQTLINEEVSKAISNIKGNLDKAYAERDTFKAKLVEMETAKQKAEIDALEKAGKHQEVMQIKMNELSSQLKAYEQKNTELSRDNAVRSQLNALDFRNEKAANMAYSDIVSNLTKDANGNWVHTSGASINEAVSSYAKDDANAFLFNVKANAGSGVSPSKPATGSTPIKSIKDMDQSEVLKAVAEGKINPTGDWTQ